MSFGGAKSEKKSLEQPEPIWRQFLLGGLSGCAAAIVTHPIDLIKVRMQIAVKKFSTDPVDGMLKTGFKAAKQEGIMALYNGLSASILRQATYTTARIGLYLQIKEALNEEGKTMPLYQKILASMLSGAGGALVGSPADVVLVRMQADGKLPLEKRRNYRHAVDGLVRLAKSEGILSLWKGCGPNINRAMLMTVGQLASYDHIKQLLLQTGYFKDNITTHFSSSLIAAFIAAALTSPFDVIKTRIMNQQAQVRQTLESKTLRSDMIYSNSFDCFRKIMQTEGIIGFYKGFVPYFVRLGPHTILTFIFFEQFARLIDTFGRR